MRSVDTVPNSIPKVIPFAKTEFLSLDSASVARLGEREEALITEFVRETMGEDDFDRNSPWTFIG